MVTEEGVLEYQLSPFVLDHRNDFSGNKRQGTKAAIHPLPPQKEGSHSYCVMFPQTRPLGTHLSYLLRAPCHPTQHPHYSALLLYSFVFPLAGWHSWLKRFLLGLQCI